MWRALAIGLGVSCCLLGVECLLIDKAILAAPKDGKPGMFSSLDPRQVRSSEVIPPDWAPWSLLSAGAVTMLYSVTIPTKAKE